MSIAEMTAAIVSTYVSKNSLAASELPALIRSVHQALSSVGQAAPAVSLDPPVPAVSIKKSITPDYLICLEDGKQFRSLKRHLATHYNLTPDQYRAKWGLSADYPMVAPSYAETRSRLAKQMGLGQRDIAPRRRRASGRGS